VEKPINSSSDAMSCTWELRGKVGTLLKTLVATLTVKPLRNVNSMQRHPSRHRSVKQLPGLPAFPGHFYIGSHDSVPAPLSILFKSRRISGRQMSSLASKLAKEWPGWHLIHAPAGEVASIRQNYPRAPARDSRHQISPVAFLQDHISFSAPELKT